MFSAKQVQLEGVELTNVRIKFLHRPGGEFPALLLQGMGLGREKLKERKSAINGEKVKVLVYKKSDFDLC